MGPRTGLDLSYQAPQKVQAGLHRLQVWSKPTHVTRIYVGHRDFANGFLLAEILSKYFPDDIKMHSFENVTSIKRKKSNWHVLLKFFKVRQQLLLRYWHT